MHIHFSNSDFIATFDGFLDKFDVSNANELHITTDDRWITVHPAILTFAAALGRQAKNVTIDDVIARSGHYLERMGLFSMLNLPSQSSIASKDSSGRFVPLTIIKTQSEQSRFITEIVPMLHLSPDQAKPIQYVFSELIRNVLEHAGPGESAIVAAQYYSKSNTIRLGICDTGYGIKRTIAPAWPGHAQTDLQAIKWALQPGISGTTSHEGGTEANGGAGLFIVKTMALLARNYFMIYSGNGVYKLLKRRPDVKKVTWHADPDRDRHSARENAPCFAGTLVAIDITLDQTEEFSDLLETIRHVNAQAIAQRRKARYKRPQFS